MSWFTAPSLRTLTAEVNDRYAPPSWPTVAIGDGSVGDTSHSARKSSHNPLWSAPGKWSGVVRAVDIGIAGRDGPAIVRALVGDPRVWYVIHKGIIRSRTYGWRARRYTGSNPHNHHIHVSLRETVTAWADTRPWFTEEERDPMADYEKQLDRIETQNRQILKRLNPGSWLRDTLNDLDAQLGELEKQGRNDANKRQVKNIRFEVRRLRKEIAADENEN